MEQAAKILLVCFLLALCFIVFLFMLIIARSSRRCEDEYIRTKQEYDARKDYEEQSGGAIDE